MDRPKLLMLIEEVETRLAGLRGWLLVGSQNGSLDFEADSPAPSLRALQNKATEEGFYEIADTAKDLANLLESARPEPGQQTHSEIRRLLDGVVKAEARMASIRFDTEDSPIDVATFVERSFDFLQIEPAAGRRASESFEIDSEMLEIFLTEAEELVSKIDDNLARLKEDPSDSNALWEIRRSTHTFKGAAGIVGLKKPSELAHRIEDLIDRFADNKGGDREQIALLLADAVRCLQALTTGENSGGLVERIERLYSDFDRFLVAGDAEGMSPLPDNRGAYDLVHHASHAETQVSPTPPGRQIVRISQNRLDELFRIVCDLVVSRSIFEQRLSDFEIQIDGLNAKTRRLQDERKSGDAFEQMLSMNASLYNVRDSLAMLFEHQRQLVEQIHQKLIGIRMVEFGSIAGRLQRTVRSTCVEENKLAEISIENEKLEIDTQILDHLIEPLMHLLKNAIVHGIEPPDTRRLLGKPETGHIVLRASNDETHIVFTITDDGAGISTVGLKEKAIAGGHVARADAVNLLQDDLLRLIFLPGITTAETLTMNAGRGVGMKIVKDAIEARQGAIAIASTPQVGTTFTIKMPLPMAVSKVLIVTASDERYAIPMRSIKNVADRASLTYEVSERGAFVTFANERVPLVSLDGLLRAGSDTSSADPLVLLLEVESKPVALAVESVLWADEILFKPLGKTNGNTDLLGEGILADHGMVPIPDIEYLLRNYKPASSEPSPVTAGTSDNMVLIVDDSPSVRYLVSKLVERLGLIVETANDGKDALHKMEVTKQRPALIISDIEMPRMDGFEFLAIAKNDPNLRNIPVVMLTSRSGEDSRQRAIDAGAAEYLLKPFDDERLIGVVQGFVRVPA